MLLINIWLLVKYKEYFGFRVFYYIVLVGKVILFFFLVIGGMYIKDV